MPVHKRSPAHKIDHCQVKVAQLRRLSRAPEPASRPTEPSLAVLIAHSVHTRAARTHTLTVAHQPLHQSSALHNAPRSPVQPSMCAASASGAARPMQAGWLLVMRYVHARCTLRMYKSSKI